MKSISEVAGVPGHEDRVRKLVLNEIKDLVDSVEVDNMGNLIALKKGKSSDKKVMSAAHMDEIGFLVTHVDDKGFIKFTTLGGFDPKTLTAQRVWVHGEKDLMGVMGGKPIHLMTAEEQKKVLKIEDYFVDVGLPGDEVKKLVKVGDTITRERNLVEIGNSICGKSLDNRVAVFILVETLRALKGKKIPYDFYAVFTTQEEVGCRGAQIASQAINPDYAICLDTTIAFDTPGAKPEEMCTRLGEGTAVKIMDGMTICDTRMVKYLNKCAVDNKIKHQTEVLVAGGTDTSMMQRAAHNGSIAGALSIPTRNIHQVIEKCAKEDVEATIELMVAGVSALDSYDWSFSS